jgi:hypothetical protein
MSKEEPLGGAMLSKSLLAMAKRVLEADINYGRRFARTPTYSPEKAKRLLEPGDIIIQFAPQLRLDPNFFNEHLLKGCMHLSCIAIFGDRPYNVELMQQGLFCIEEIFDDLDREAIYMKRYYLVLRHKRVHRDAALRHAINESIQKFSGFEDHGGVAVRTRRVFINFFLRTNPLQGKKTERPPQKLYCSELVYHAYRENGIEICKLHTLDDLLKRVGGMPDRPLMKRIMRRYSKTSMLNYYGAMTLYELDRVGRWLHLPFLRPSRAVISHAVWPHIIFENPEFELIALVPPSQPYIVMWNRMLQEGEGPEPEIER